MGNIAVLQLVLKVHADCIIHRLTSGDKYIGYTYDIFIRIDSFCIELTYSIIVPSKHTALLTAGCKSNFVASLYNT